MTNPKSNTQELQSRRPESKDLYRILFESASDAILLMEHGHLTDCNASTLALFGCAREELVGQSLLKFSPPIQPDGRNSKQALQREVDAALSGERRRFEWLYQRLDGETFYAQVTLQRLEVGSKTLIQVSVQDITAHKQAEESLARRATQLETAAEVSHAASGLLDPDELIQQVVDLVRKRFGFYYVGLFLVDETGEWAVLRAGTGEAGRIQLEQGHKLKVGGESMIGWCVANAQARIALDVGEEAVRFANPLLPETRSEMALPLVSRRQVIGAMTIQSTQAAAFSEEDITVLQTMADQMASAIENARLFEDTKSRLAQLTALQETTQAVASTLELDKFLHLITQQATTLLQGDGGITNLADWDNKEEEVVAASGSQTSVLGLRSPLEGSLSGWATLHNQPVISNQVQDDSRADARVRSGELQIQSAVIAPLTIKDQVMGTLVVVDKQGGKVEFDRADLDLLMAFANQAAIALQNARLFEETQAALAEMENLTEALRISEERYALAMQGSNDGIWDWDIANDTLYWSPRFKELLGYAPDELEAVFETFESHLHPDDRERMALAIEAHLKDRMPYDVEQRLRTKSGEYRWFNARGQAIWDETGQPLRMTGFITDITERKQAVEALRTSEAKYRALFTRMADPIFIFDEETKRFIDCNQAAIDRYGYTLEELRAMTPHQLHPPEDLDEVERNIDDSENTSAHHYTHITKNGERLQVEVRTAALEYEGRKAWISIVRDITERKQAVEALRVSEERFALAVRGTNDGLWDWDIVNNSLYWSPHMKELLGYADDELDVDFDTFDSFLHPDDKEHTGAAIEAHLKDRVPYDIEQRLRTKSGEYRWFHVRGEAVWDEAGQPLRMVGASTDITERKQAEAERERLLAEMDSLAKELAVLNELGQALTARLNVDQVLEEAHRGASRLLDTTNFNIGIYRPEKDEIAFPLIVSQSEIDRQITAIPASQGVAGYIVRNRTSVLIPENVGEQLAEMGVEPVGEIPLSLLGVPLIVGDQTLGTMTVQSFTTPCLYDEHSRDLLTAIASQVAIALQNARQFERAQARARREKALRQITTTINTSDDLPTALPAISQQLRELAPADVLALVSYTPGESEFTYVAVGEGGEDGPSVQQGVRLKIEGSGPEWVITHREPWLGADIRQRKTFVEDEQMISQGVVARLILPLQIGDQVIGTLNLGSGQPGAFTEEHLPILSQIADQMALALERARLLEETRAALAEVEATHRRYLREEWADLLAATPDHVWGYIDGRDGLIPANEVLTPEIEQAITTGELTTVVESADGDGQAPRTALAVPIRLRGQIIGVLDFYDEGRIWTEDDKALVTALADQVALALENQRLFEQTQRRAERERRIHEITSKIRRSPDIAAILQTTVDELGQALQADRVLLRLRTKSREEQTKH